MKLLAVAMTALLATSAPTFIQSVMDLPDDPLAAGVGALELASSIDSLAPGVADQARAAIALAGTAATPGDVLRAAAQLAPPGRTPSPDIVAMAQRQAAILDVLDTVSKPDALEVLDIAARIATVGAGAQSLPLDLPIQFNAPGDAFTAMLQAQGLAMDATRSHAAARLDALPEPTRTGVLLLLDAHVQAYAAQSRDGEGELDPRGFLAHRVALATPLLEPQPTSGENDLVECGVYDISLADEPTLHTCADANLITLDLGGDDTYNANGGVLWNDCAIDAVGCTDFHLVPTLFLDVAGDDTYRSTGSLHNGAVMGGVLRFSTATPTGNLLIQQAPFSAFFDVSGNDEYSISVDHSDSRGTGTSGIFVDAAGDDVHIDTATLWTASTMGTRGGIFVEGSGNDSFSLTLYNTCAGAMIGAIAVDLGGSDTWVVRCGYAFGARDAIFADVGGGDDSFHSVDHPRESLGACRADVCTFRDDGGTNVFKSGIQFSYDTTTMGAFYSSTTGVRAPMGLGVMLTGPGDDTFETYGSTSRAGGTAMGGGIAGIGILVDEGGHNTYIVGNLLRGGQGYSEDGIGLLVDRGDSANFDLYGGVGQGASIRGIAMIIQTRGDAPATYTAGSSALPSLTTGGGLGARLHRGPVALSGTQPTFTCASQEQTLVGVSGAVVLGRKLTEFNVCAPGQEDGDQILSPADGSEVDDLDRPALHCTDVPGVAWCPIVADSWGEGTVDWLDDDKITMRTAGGLSVLSATGLLSLKFELPSADGACKVSCATWGNLDSVG